MAEDAAERGVLKSAPLLFMSTYFNSLLKIFASQVAASKNSTFLWQLLPTNHAYINKSFYGLVGEVCIHSLQGLAEKKSIIVNNYQQAAFYY